MIPTYDHAGVQVYHGDCFDVLASFPADSIDAIVTDPPYGIGFMGREWDTFAPGAVAKTAAGKKRKAASRADVYPEGGDTTSQGGGVSIQYDESPTGNQRFQAWCAAWARECLRVLKPGGHMLVCGGPRTFHRMTCGIEDAGFEIRDVLTWLYGSGFPKSLDVSKAIDKTAGATREVIGQHVNPAGNKPGGNAYMMSEKGMPEAADITAPATDAAIQWQGWGTALKPGWEPVVMARKPFRGTVANNVLTHGTGALNIDACRIGTESRTNAGMSSLGVMHDDNWKPGIVTSDVVVRWPANVVLDEVAAAMLDAQSGDRAAGNRPAHRQGIGFTKNAGGTNSGTEGDRIPLDSGGASRFFYTAKPSTSERNAGLHHRTKERVDQTHADGRVWDIPGSHATPRANHHPTVKPVSLMQWLVRMVTPPGGRVLDPFAGSGTTGIAAYAEWFDAILIEREAEYVEIIRGRIEHMQRRGRQAALTLGDVA